MQSRSPFEDLECFVPPPAVESASPPASAETGRIRRHLRPGWATSFLSGALVAAIATASGFVIATHRGPAEDPRPRPIADVGGTRSESTPSEIEVDRSLFGFRAPQSDHAGGSKKSVRKRSSLEIAPAPQAFAAAPSIASSTPDATRRPSARKKAPPPPPQPDRVLYHLYSRRLSDHLFTIDRKEMERRVDASYDLLAIEGVMFASNMAGTKPLTTPDGTVGFIWAKRHPDALALYWFYGPEGEYFTSSDAMAAEISDEPGWESRGIAGFVAPPPA